MEIFSIFARDNDESYARGVLSGANYERGKKRSLVSLKMCLISWSIEFVGTALAAAYPLIHSMGLNSTHYIDCIIMNIIIPFVYLMNDEETKGIIAEENWYQGLRHMLGVHQENQMVQ